MPSGPAVKQIVMVTPGAIIINNGAGKSVELAPSTDGDVLSIVSGVPAYVDPQTLKVNPHDVWRYSLLHKV